MELAYALDFYEFSVEVMIFDLSCGRVAACCDARGSPPFTKQPIWRKVSGESVEVGTGRFLRV